MHQGFWLALMVTPIAMVALYFSPLALQFMDVDPVMAEKTAGYLHAILWGLPAFVLFQVLRNFSEGLSHTMPTMVIGFVGLAVNIPANYIFIHGHFGMPKLGGVGCGVATAIVLWAMLLAMIAYVKLSPLQNQSVRPARAPQRQPDLAPVSLRLPHRHGHLLRGDPVHRGGPDAGPLRRRDGGEPPDSPELLQPGVYAAALHRRRRDHQSRPQHRGRPAGARPRRRPYLRCWAWRWPPVPPP